MRYFFFFLFVSLFTYGQNIHFNNVTTKDGLSNNSVNTMFNHKDGSLWIGTWDGLNLYDGKKITVYKHNPQNASSIAGNNIYKITSDYREELWIWCDDQKVSLYRGKDQFINYSFPASIIDMSLTVQGELLVTLNDGSKYLWKSGEFVKDQLHKVLLEPKDAWITDLKHLFKDTVINDVIKEDDLHFWVATKDKGLYYISKVHGKYVIQDTYTTDPYNTLSLRSNEIVVLHRDLLGNLWLGTKDGGIAMMVNRNEDIKTIYSHHKEQPFLPSETVRAITEDQQGRLWLGYYTQGIYTQDKKGGVFRTYPLTRAKVNADWLRIRSLYTDSYGSIWIGTYAGVIQIRDGEQIYYEQGSTPHFTNNRNYHFQESGPFLWIACWGGIAKFDLIKQQFVPFLNQKTLMKYHIRHISVDAKQLLLATEKEGVVFYDISSGEINHLNLDDGVLGNSVYVTYVDPYSKDIWIGSLGGISIFSSAKQLKQQLTEEKGLPSHLVYSFLPYKNKIWISTTKGIASIDKKSMAVLNFSNYNGWQGLEFSEGAAYQNTQGKLMFAGNRGVNLFDAEKLQIPKEVPDFKIVFNGEPVVVNEMVERAFKDNDIKLELYPIGFNTYLKNQFEYRIEGLFDDWRVLPQNDILLDKLAPNTYNIQVRNTLGTKKEVVFSKSFVIRKPFYANPFFILIVIAVLISLFVWRFKRKQQIVLQREIALKKEVALRTEEVLLQKESLRQQYIQLDNLNGEILKQQKEVLELHSRFKNADIEIEKFRVFVLSKIKKSLVEILGSLDHVAMHNTTKNKVVGLYDMVREWDYLEQIKDFDSPQKISIRLQDLINKLHDEWKYNEKKTLVSIDVKSSIGKQRVEIDLMRLKFLFKYFMNDCCKYMKQDEKIEVSFDIVEDYLEVSIASESKLLQTYWRENSLFSPYYRAFFVLLQDLSGSLIDLSQRSFQVLIRLPLDLSSEAQQENNAKDWNIYLQELQTLPKDKNNLLVYAEDQDHLLVLQLLGSEERYQLIYNNQINEVISNIEHYKFDALILYNIPISDALLSLFSRIQKTVNKQRLLIFYIAEEVDYFLQEQLVQLGVTDFIHLPLNKNIIENKIQKRISYDKQNKEATAYMWNSEVIEQEDRLESSNERLLRKAMEMMTSKLGNADFGIEQLTEQLGISKMKCYRIFKEILQISPSEVLIQLRLKKAENMLQYGNLTVSEISFECGFNDPKYFSKTFKKHYQVSPSSYKKEESIVASGLSEY
ncbi:helix-turn-helix domain-containing protein [Flavobacterium sp. HSC-61S13]|uniref:helix-turn-helix domain-containing protein n=1 Tax=Flavobacterium sp. HSC-61S13 TaxID=2910963 RepID=UPI00209FE305|nr:helix-turn-helix domain-containing protein [Flavobacterium sp. HSC-61S13]MCP1996385.1 ligand-binding sensor domain-containing protein/AraC-like DNA-binding protein [Flavobacterium sp. HSC-61S13]